VDINPTQETQSVSSNIAKEKIAVYDSISKALGLLLKEIELIEEWKSRIQGDSEKAKLSLHFPVSGIIGRLRTKLAAIDDLRFNRRWLIGWKIEALLYAISLKGREMLAAVECYGGETSNWELKRGHFLAASGLGGVVSKYESICARECRNDLQNPSHIEPTDQDQRVFFKQLGDIGRAESKSFSEQYPKLHQDICEANRKLTADSNRDFKFDLTSTSLLEAEDHTDVISDHANWIDFVEQLYSRCTDFYFQIWNEPISEEPGDFSRLRRLLAKVSTPEIQIAFTKMVREIQNACENTLPVESDQFESEEALEKHKLETLAPSALAYDRLHKLTEAHLDELRKSKGRLKSAPRVQGAPQPKTEAVYSGTVYVFANLDPQNMRSGKPGDFGFPVADNVEKFFRIGFLVGTSKPAKMDFNRPGKKYTPPSLIPPLKPDENAPKIKVEKVWLIFNDLLLAKAIDWKARNVSDYEQLIATFAISDIPPGFIQDGDTTVGMKVAIQAGDGSEWRSISTAIGAGFLRF